MDHSPLKDKNSSPVENDLKAMIGKSNTLWKILRLYTLKSQSHLKEEWYYYNEKSGWNFRIKDKKRAIIYLLPRENYFIAAFVFGRKAFETIMKSEVSISIKNDLQKARVYAEGRGIRIAVDNNKIISDIKILIDIKVSG